MRRPNVMRPGVRVRLSAVALLALGASGCDWWYYRTPQLEEAWYAIPWFDHMIKSRYVHPYETDSVVRYTPTGAVPVGETEPDWSAEWVRGDATTANRLINPFTKSSVRHEAKRAQGAEIPVVPRDFAAAGDTLYGTFCAVCHGSAGDGRGPVGPQVAAPSLLTGRARAYSDGYLYSVIRYGRGAMPRYGDKVYDANDRWAIVSHLRTLQANMPPAAEPPAASAPIPPGASMTGSTGAFPQ
jgi:mono/diheme cytochrome c family protein